VVFSYPWANDLVYRSVGEQPPARGAPRGGPGSTAGAPARDVGGANRARADWGSGGGVLSYDELFERAAAHAGDWRKLTLNVPADANAATTVRFGVDQGNGGQPQLRHSLSLDAATGALESWLPFSSQSTGQQARSWIRFLHTGEALGVVGQTVAGLVSLTSVLMVWTGLALAYRRLIAPLFARRSATRSAEAA
jgi:uncharacterized iron-regulated membrane protein